MLKFLRRKKTKQIPEQEQRLREGLSNTRKKMFGGLASLILGKKVIDKTLLEELEAKLLTADVGVRATQQLIDALTQKIARKELNNPEALIHNLKEQLIALLAPCSQPLIIPDDIKPYVILMVGVNGSGKTTTIGKLAKIFMQQGKTVMLAAGDTFRAAAIEQLQIWGERNNVGVIAQKPGSDSAAVIYDALQAAKARNYDILIADTAGRLHTQTNLMAELQKTLRVIKKLDATAPHEIILTLDAHIGQNALAQTKQFNAAVQVSGIVLTKLDGTAKGGVIFALAKDYAIPIRFVGVGEKIDDLQPFDAMHFVDALLEE